MSDNYQKNQNVNANNEQHSRFYCDGKMDFDEHNSGYSPPADNALNEFLNATITE